MKKRFVSLVLVLLMLLSVGVFAAAAAPEQGSVEMNYVVDAADILDFAEWQELEARAESVSARYGCGVYIVTVDDYTDYGTGSVYDVTTQIYNFDDIGFGIGAERNGIMLLLSMAERDWAMFVIGDTAAYAFNADGQKMLENVFLDDFRDNDWYGGFSDYINSCNEYLAKAEAGAPVKKSASFALPIGLAIIIALAVCLVMKGQMKTVYQKVEADAYTVGDIKLTRSYDRFTHITETRRTIEKNDSSGSSQSESGGGGTGRSGKF